MVLGGGLLVEKKDFVSTPLSFSLFLYLSLPLPPSPPLMEETVLEATA